LFVTAGARGGHPAARNGTRGSKDDPVKGGAEAAPGRPPQGGQGHRREAQRRGGRQDERGGRQGGAEEVHGGRGGRGEGQDEGQGQRQGGRGGRGEEGGGTRAGPDHRAAQGRGRRDPPLRRDQGALQKARRRVRRGPARGQGRQGQPGRARHRAGLDPRRGGVASAALLASGRRRG